MSADARVTAVEFGDHTIYVSGLMRAFAASGSERTAVDSICKLSDCTRAEARAVVRAVRGQG